MPTLPDLLSTTLKLGGSDLHLSVGSAPQVRVNGDLRRLDEPILTSDATRSLVYSVLSDAQKKLFEETWEQDMAFGLEGVGRFRCNVFMQKSAVGAVFRLIPEKIPSLEDLGLPPVIGRFADRPRGLVLVTGPTGSGKSTTLAAMVDRINASKPVHILTIEDPIEYLHTHKTALVNQREVHQDTRTFPNALRGALREDPDVVLVGEMRDLETMEAAMKLAETGHLTLATLHTNSAAQTVTRIIDAFPSWQQSQIRAQLSLVLEGIVCQSLLPKSNGTGRAAALEILVATPAIRNLIREKFSMQTMNQALARLIMSRVISKEVGMAASSHKEELTQMMDRERVRT